MSERKRNPRPPYPPEVRERAVRMVFDHQGEYSSQWKAIESIAAKLSINHETLRIWVRRAETDAGERPGLTTDERAQIHELQKEVKELRRANEILNQRPFSSGRSSTADSRDSGLHRRPPRPLRGRADLPGAHRARSQDCPQHLLGSEEAAAEYPSRARRRAPGRDHPGPRREPRRLWDGQSLDPAQPRRHQGGSLHRRALDA
jgi:transposase